ncbi:MAG: peptide chain release factor N(5)-glutamine methyltransferase [Alphaproteobacteria bacterium]
MATDLNSLLQNYKQRLDKAGVPNASYEVAYILQKILNIDLSQIRNPQNIQVDQENLPQLEKVISLREKRVPSARIFETTEFCGLNVRTVPNVFMPYKETEMMVEHAIDNLKDASKAYRILDLGTGTGCILLAILNAVPNSSGIGIDNDQNALNLAKDNAIASNLEDRSEFRLGIWGADINEKFDLVISNPPRVATQDLAYLIPEMRDHDPHVALDGGKDSLEYFRRTADCFDSLTSLTSLGVFQVGSKQAEAARNIFVKRGFNCEINTNYIYMPYCITVTK